MSKMGRGACCCDRLEELLQDANEGEICIPAGSIVCYLPEESQLENVDLAIVGEDWIVVNPGLATQTYTAPDGTVITFSMTRLAGNGAVNNGADLFGRKTVELGQTDNNPTTWELSWDVPFNGRVAIAMGDIDASTESLANWSPASPDNLGDINAIDDNQDVIFEWNTSLKDPVAAVQFEYTGLFEDSIILGPFKAWLEVETYRIRQAFVSYTKTLIDDCETQVIVFRDTLTNEILTDPNLVNCSTSEFSWERCLSDETGLEFQRIFYLNAGIITFEDYSFDGGIVIPIGNPTPCSVGTSDFEIVCLCDCLNDTQTPFLRHVIRDSAGNITTNITTLDGTTPYVITGSVSKCRDSYLIPGYIRECELFENTLPINAQVTFEDSPIGTNTIAFASPNAQELVRQQIIKSQDVESEEIKHGLPVTPFVINTSNNEIYSFNPSALQPGIGSLVIDESGIIAWGINQTETLTDIEYSTLDSCECKPVEVLQVICNSNVYLVDIIDSNVYNSVTGLKTSLLDENRLLEFASQGPFPGPCANDPQVIELDQLCCNDDLLTGEPDISNQRLVWADGSDIPNLYNNGLPITGNLGDAVDEIRDKIAPGVSPSIVTQPGSGDPEFIPNAYNNLGILRFDGVNDRMRVDFGPRPANQPFSLFYLVSTTDQTSSNASILAVGPTGGGSYAIANTWQIARDSLSPSFIFRGAGAAGNQTPWADPVEENIPCPTCDPNIEFAFSDLADFADGRLHLITVNFDGSRLTGYFDGFKSFVVDLQPATMFTNEYFRLGGNRQNDSALEMDLAETFISTDALSSDDISTINAYLICKWGIDPSLAAGGSGDLVLADSGSYSAPTPFVKIIDANGDEYFKNTLNGQNFPVPPLPGLSICAGTSGSSGVVGQTDLVVNGDTTIPQGTISYSIYIESGTADINGATRPTGYSLNQFPMSFGDLDRLYPEINITNVTGTVHIVYVEA